MTDGAPAAPATPARTEAAGGQGPGRGRRRDIQLVALDMDGTLLNSNSRVLPSSVAALRAVLAAGVTVMLATGKARPAAMAALAEVGLTGGLQRRDAVVVHSGEAMPYNRNVIE